ncbi:MAG: ubiquitin-like small modifier protein 1 [Anaerolineaceae bacterium]
MRINLYASFREHAGVKQFDLPVSSATTVHDAIHQIIRLYPALQNAWMDQNGELHAHVQVSLNQVDIFALPDGLSTPVQNSDTLDFFPPIHGG